MGKSKYDEDKPTALKYLKDGDSARAVARQLNIPYSTILRWAKELEDVKTAEDLNTIIDAPGSVVHDIAAQVQEEYSKLVEDPETLVGEIVEGVDGLQKLSGKLQNSATEISTKLHAMAIVCSDPKEILILADALSKIQQAFFARGMTINNNTLVASEKKVSKWKGLMRPA